MCVYLFDPFETANRKIRETIDKNTKNINKNKKHFPECLIYGIALFACFSVFFVELFLI